MIRRLAIATALILAVGCSGSSKTTEDKTAESKPGATGAGQAGAAQGGAGQAGGQQSAGQQTAARGLDQTAAGAQQAAQGLQQVAQGLQQMAKGAATPIDSDQLKTLLPDISGWTKGEAHGEMISFGISQSNAKVTYTKGDSTIELSITDSAGSQILLAPLAMMMGSGFEEKSDDGYKKAVTIGGAPGFEEWEKGPKHAQATAVVASRFVVAADAHHVDDAGVAVKAVEAVNLSKLAGMK
ncbi:MAG TPA: hypothetical protein VLT86_20810 [Vicinamibacterales bacterium]|nr:hypothetical protein [Vicinamibacterales bacterium]